MLVAIGSLNAFAEAANSHSPVNSRCFWIHGSLADDIGHPSYRITPETKDGLLAVPDDDRQPAYLWSLFPPDERAVETTITGDFLVCPLEPPQPARLRLVQIRAVRHLHRKIDNWLEHPERK
jgi:hypothetical protein